MSSFRDNASSGTRLPPIGIDLTSPEGRAKAIAIGASECLKGAMELDEGFSDLTGEYILTFHAIELGLKAFLTSKGLDEKKVRGYKHNLVQLYQDAKSLGLSIDYDNTEETIAWINEWHCDGVRIRYEFTTARELPMCSTLFPLAKAIISVTGMRPNALRL